MAWKFNVPQTICIVQRQNLQRFYNTLHPGARITLRIIIAIHRSFP